MTASQVRAAIIQILQSSNYTTNLNILDNVTSVEDVITIQVYLENYINKYKGCGLNINYLTNEINIGDVQILVEIF